MEDMPNMTMMGNTLNFKGKGINRSEGGRTDRRSMQLYYEYFILLVEYPRLKKDKVNIR